MITLKKWDELRARMQQLGLYETDILERFILGSGSGGQNLHKTASTVYLKHFPSGIEIKCQQSRSRDNNRLYARRLLCEKFVELVLREKSERQQAMEKIRRQKRRRSRKAKEKMLKDKKQRSQLKALRKPLKD